MKTFARRNNGFTLIELMIVIAIIGILAAIAIPQMAVYRTRAYNASAESDLRNILGVEATLLDDGLAYGSSGEGTLPGTGGAQGAGTQIGGPLPPASESSSGGLLSGNHPISGQVVGAGIGLGNGVFFRADTMAQDASFIIYARHRMGQRAFAFDVDNTTMMACENKNWIGKDGLQVTTVATVRNGAMDLTGACSADPAANWTAF